MGHEYTQKNLDQLLNTIFFCDFDPDLNSLYSKNHND